MSTRQIWTAGLVFALMATCPHVAAQPRDARLDVPFELKPAESAVIADTRLAILLQGVIADSRCPVDLQCISAGDAAVDVRLSTPPDDPRSAVLHTDGRQGQQAEYQGYRVRLVGVAPQRRDGGSIAPEDYRVTLLVTRVASK